MNKNNLVSLIVLLVIFSLIIIMPKVIAPYDLGVGNLPVVSETTTKTNSQEELGVEPVDGTVNLEAKSVEITVTSEFNTIKTAGGTIPNVKSGNLVVENGNPVSGKLVFSADSRFDLDDKHITVPKDGSIEFKDGKIIVSKGTSIEVDDTEIQAMVDETEIKIWGDIIEAKGYISVDYENSPSKITLTGKDSILEIQTEDKEKFEFKNSDNNDIAVNIGSFHKSEDCTGKNCISYQEMGIGISGEEWNKLKVDGNAIITKTVTKYEGEEETKEKIYEINFKDGEAKLSRDLSKLKDTDFSEKTVINYNSGDITFFIETSEEKAKEIDGGRINTGKGTGDIEDDTNVHIVTESPTVELPETPKPPETDSELKEKARGVDIGDKTLYDIVEEKGEDIISEELILAWINQESSMSQDAKLGGCVGFTQVSAISFKDVINRNPEKYKEYLSYTTNEELTKAIEDDALLNLEVGFDYMNSLKTTYGFSQEKVESNYKYTGSEEDILLMAYNAGPTITKDILTEFKNTGGGDWDELEEFLHTDETLNIFKKYKGSYGVKDTDTEEEVNSKLEWKINIVINYVKNIRKNANQ